MGNRQSLQPVTPQLLVKMPFHSDLIELLCHLRHTSFSYLFLSYRQNSCPGIFPV
jgi:hypothetical protein